MVEYRNPTPTVDCIIELEGERVVLIRRAHPPLGWALPGGFVDEGERLDAAAVREAKEETGLDVELLESAPPERQRSFSGDFGGGSDGDDRVKTGTEA